MLLALLIILLAIAILGGLLIHPALWLVLIAALAVGVTASRR